MTYSDEYRFDPVEGGGFVARHVFEPVAPFDQDQDIPTDERYAPAMRVVTPIDSFDYVGTWVTAGVLA